MQGKGKSIIFVRKSRQNGMNQELNDTIVRLETRIRQLIMQQQQLLEEQARLHTLLDEKDDMLLEAQIQNEELKQQYSRLKMAKYIDMADNDVKDMRGRLRTMVRDIDRCISMLKVTQ